MWIDEAIRRYRRGGLPTLLKEMIGYLGRKLKD